MACPPTHTVVKGELKNGPDDCLASLMYSNYQGAPVTIKKDSLPTPFAQNMVVDGLYGGLVYDVVRVKWIILWTSDYKVATKIIPTENHIVWEDIVSILQPYDSSDNLSLSCGGAFSSEAHIHANGDGSLNLTAQIMWSGCK
uniref:MIC-3 n=1 Tax=Gossypium longicalyx TaxID=34280 RepID=D8UVE1_9ROSI|nr:MIC-3 [Gossypium longicalyx]